MHIGEIQRTIEVEPLEMPVFGSAPAPADPAIPAVAREPRELVLVLP